MQKNILIILLLLLSFIAGCTSSKMSSINNSQKILFDTSSEKEPEWVKSGKMFWYEPDEQAYYVVGIANNETDIGFGASIAQAYALKNIAQKIQTIFNSNFALIETGSSSDVKNLSELLISAITKNVQMSVAMTEQYWKEWQLNSGYQTKYVYDIFTLNQISKQDLERAINNAIESSKRSVENSDLRFRLDKFKEEIQKELNR